MLYDVRYPEGTTCKSVVEKNITPPGLAGLTCRFAKKMKVPVINNDLMGLGSNLSACFARRKRKVCNYILIVFIVVVAFFFANAPDLAGEQKADVRV